jgi:DNA (cytosine-5)-methyltransferase 1
VILNAFGGIGVTVAAKEYGSKTQDLGVMDDLLATRSLLGLSTPFVDIWDFDTVREFPTDLYWAYLPLPKGVKPAQLAERIHGGLWDDMAALRELEDVGDALLPVTHVARFLPRAAAFEQEPEYLPLFEAVADVFRAIGYSVWAGILHAEQYGVAQLRPRAYLLARRDGVEAKCPAPTHSRYNHQAPYRTDDSLPLWRSAADVLSLPPDLWFLSERVCTPLSVPIRTLTPRARDLVLIDSFNERPNARERLLYRDVVQTPVTQMQSRLISPEEAALLQGFTPTTKFAGNRKSVFTQITRATPPPVVRAVLAALDAHSLETIV